MNHLPTQNDKERIDVLDIDYCDRKIGIFMVIGGSFHNLSRYV